MYERGTTRNLPDYGPESKSSSDANAFSYQVNMLGDIEKRMYERGTTRILSQITDPKVEEVAMLALSHTAPGHHRKPRDHPVQQKDTFKSVNDSIGNKSVYETAVETGYEMRSLQFYRQISAIA